MDTNTLAAFRPKVKPGKIENINNLIFYSIESSGQKIKVPQLFVDFFTLAEGQNTIQDIFTCFYERHQHVPFRGFLNFIFDLAKKNILENSKELLQFQNKKTKVESAKNLVLIAAFLEILVMVGFPAWRNTMISPLALTLSSYFLLESWSAPYFNFFVLFPLIFCLNEKAMFWGLPWLAAHAGIWFLKRSLKKPKANKDAINLFEQLVTLPVFAPLSELELKHLLSTAKSLDLESQALITKKGEVAQHVYVLVEGEAEVLVPNNKIVLKAPCVFGESALQSESVRQADIRSLTNVKILQLDVNEFPKNDNPEVLELEIATKQFFKSSPVFSYFGEPVANAFLMYGRVLFLGPEQTIFEENSTGDSLFLLLRGSVEIQIQGKPLKQLKQGDLFGEISLMAHVPRTASVISKENALLLEIPSMAFWEILTQNLDLALLIESIGAQRFNENQEFKKQFKATG